MYCTLCLCIVLHCIVFCCTVLYSIVLYCTALHCIVLYCIVLYCTVLYCIAFRSYSFSPASFPSSFHLFSLALLVPSLLLHLTPSPSYKPTQTKTHTPTGCQDGYEGVRESQSVPRIPRYTHMHSHIHPYRHTCPNTTYIRIHSFSICYFV